MSAEDDEFLRRAPSRRRSVVDKGQLARASNELSPHKLISGLSTEEREKQKRQEYFEEITKDVEVAIESMKAKKELLLDNLRELELRSEELEEDESQRLLTKKRLADLRTLCRNLETQRDKHNAKIKERELLIERLQEKKKDLEKEVSVQLMLEEATPRDSWAISVPGVLLLLFLGAILLVGLLGWVEWDDRQYYRHRFRPTFF